MQPHHLILQKLDQYLTNFGGKVFYPRSTFERVNYTGKPVIFWEGAGIPKHPDFHDVDSGNLPAGYRVVGQITNTSMDGDLQKADAIITDEELDADMSANPSSYTISSGFWGRIADGVMHAVDGANHVLLFRRDGGNPNDSFAQVCNVASVEIWPNQLENGIQIGENMANEKKTSAPVQVGNAPAPEPAPEAAPSETSVEDRLMQLAAENEQLKALVQQLVEKMKELTGAAGGSPEAAAAAPVGNTADNNELSALRAENAKLKKQNADFEWAQLEKTLPAQMQGPVGRMEYDTNQTAFLKKALGMHATTPAPVGNTAADGATIQQPEVAKQKLTTFVTPEYAWKRQIGNVEAPSEAVEGTRLGPHLWALHGGMKLDSTHIDRKYAVNSIVDKYGGF